MATDTDIEELELDELEPAEEVEKAPPKKKSKKGKKAKKEPAVKFGTKDLAAHITEETDYDVDARKLRILLRKLNEEGVIDHDKNSRYSWSGPKDKQVKQIMAAIDDGALEPARGDDDDDDEDTDEEE